MEEEQIVLHVRPIDFGEAGSYMLRRRVLRASKAINEALEADDGMGAIDAAIQIEDVVLERCYTENGTPVEDVLAEISANDFDALLAALMEQTPVDPTNESS